MRRRQARTSQGLTAPALRRDHGESRPASALTRRGFLGAVAALVVAPASPVPPPVPAFTAGRLVFHPKAFSLVMAPLGGWPVLHGNEAVLTAEQAGALVDAYLARVVAE